MKFQDLFLPSHTPPQKKPAPQQTPPKIKISLGNSKPPKKMVSSRWDIKYQIDAANSLAASDSPANWLEAEKIYRRALELDSERQFPEINFKLAVLQEKKGDLDSLLAAKDYYREYQFRRAYDSAALFRYALLKTRIGVQKGQILDINHIQTLLRQALVSRGFQTVPQAQELVDSTSQEFLTLIQPYYQELLTEIYQTYPSIPEVALVTKSCNFVSFLYFLSTFANLKPVMSIYGGIRFQELPMYQSSTINSPDVSETSWQQTPKIQLVLLGTKLGQKVLQMLDQPISLQTRPYHLVKQEKISQYYYSFLTLLKIIFGTAYLQPDEALAAYQKGRQVARFWGVVQTILTVAVFVLLISYVNTLFSGLVVATVGLGIIACIWEQYFSPIKIHLG